MTWGHSALKSVWGRSVWWRGGYRGGVPRAGPWTNWPHIDFKALKPKVIDITQCGPCRGFHHMEAALCPIRLIEELITPQNGWQPRLHASCGNTGAQPQKRGARRYSMIAAMSLLCVLNWTIASNARVANEARISSNPSRDDPMYGSAR